jgi:hypothetical protein
MPVHAFVVFAFSLALLTGRTAASEPARADDGAEPRVCQGYTKGTAEDRTQFLDAFKAAVAVFTGKVEMTTNAPSRTALTEAAGEHSKRLSPTASSNERSGLVAAYRPPGR